MLGLLFSFFSNFFAYLLYRTILLNEKNKETIGYVKRCSQGWMNSAIFLLSLVVFALVMVLTINYESTIGF